MVMNELFRSNLQQGSIKVHGINFVQINQSHSIGFRSLHLQLQPNEQGKLVRCVKGKFFDAAVDLRRNSPDTWRLPQ